MQGNTKANGKKQIGGKMMKTQAPANGIHSGRMILNTNLGGNKYNNGDYEN